MAPEPSTTPGADPRDPALDGIRGLAVAAVVAFHGGFGWARGGYLGVSTFFTLSGFLITRLLLREQDRTGRTSLRRFWARRARRLWPASLATLLAVAVLAWLAFEPSEVREIELDILSALGQVANWRFVLEERSYADLFTSPSLVLHFWSLAVEEQLYLVVPLAVALCGRARNRHRALGIVIGVGAAGSLGLTLVLAARGATDRIYYGTDTRAFELLAGAALALAVVSRERVDRARGPWVEAAGWLGLAASAAAWVLVEQTQAIVTRGGLPLYALLSVGLILGARAPGPLRRALSWGPLVRLGAISYAVYLFHWPLIQLLSASRLRTSREVAFVLAVLAAVGLAALSHQLLETPIRTGRARWVGRGRRAGALAAAGFAVVVLAAVVVPIDAPALDLDQAQAELDAILDNPDVPAKPGAPRVAFVGDSTALAAALGMSEWASKTGEVQIVPGSTDVGCGLVSEGLRFYNGGSGPVWEGCGRNEGLLPDIGADADLVVYFGGAWDVASYRLPGSDEVLSIEDSELRRIYVDRLEEIYEAVRGGGAIFAFVIVPDMEVGVRGGRSPSEPAEASDPRRIALYNDMGRDLAERHPDGVTLIDLRGFMDTLPGGPLDRDVRPDGIHLSEETAVLVAEEFLGPAVIAAATGAETPPS